MRYLIEQFKQALKDAAEADARGERCECPPDGLAYQKINEGLGGGKMICRRCHRYPKWLKVENVSPGSSEPDRAVPSVVSVLKEFAERFRYSDEQLEQLATCTTGRGEISPSEAQLHIKARAAIARQDVAEQQLLADMQTLVADFKAWVAASEDVDRKTQAELLARQVMRMDQKWCGGEVNDG